MKSFRSLRKTVTLTTFSNEELPACRIAPKFLRACRISRVKSPSTNRIVSLSTPSTPETYKVLSKVTAWLQKKEILVLLRIKLLSYFNGALNLGAFFVKTIFLVNVISWKWQLFDFFEADGLPTKRRMNDISLISASRSNNYKGTVCFKSRTKFEYRQSFCIFLLVVVGKFPGNWTACHK